ncbi:MAG TPA: tetratricopeptide repeat protein [Thermoanaerobaculia bacterium]|nr:tetratricopeptide repeat protein [Thermoanaerobaculia bacterium]
MAIVLFPLAVVAQESRIASDFEIEQMERQVARRGDFLSHVSARLNLGDLRMSRNESTAARNEYLKARESAQKERLETRKRSELAAYATATMYAALAAAKLGETAQAVELMEEALRYASDDAKSWNLYASAMNVLGLPQKAAAAARTAIVIADTAAAKEPSIANRLDTALYRYSLASALLSTSRSSEAEPLLRQAIDTLRSPQFDPIRKEIARRESFEIYSSARGEEAAYLSLLTRAQLRLASIYEARGDVKNAVATYAQVLAARSDEPDALAALARLARTSEERQRYFAEAFEANPFSLSLIREYRRHLAASDAISGAGGGESDASNVRRAVQLMARREHREARTVLETLLKRFPGNDTLNFLAAENDLALGDVARAKQRRIASRELRRQFETALAAATAPVPAFLTSRRTPVSPSARELRQMITVLANERLTPEQRVSLDRLTMNSIARFDPAVGAAPPGQTIFESGKIEDVPFRFSEPTAFSGTFAPGQPLRLTYRILGATTQGGSEALLLEPLGVQPAR